jgi:hypothetical protein
MPDPTDPSEILRAEKLREDYKKELLKLKGLEAGCDTDSSDLLEVHMYCGSSQLDRGVWASWSLLRFFENYRLYVHSDGTLNEIHGAFWRRYIPHLHLVGVEEANQRINDYFSENNPLLRKWSQEYWCSAQVVDAHLFGKAPKILIMDSDVLCFSDPKELRSELKNPGSDCRWNEEAGDSVYSAKPETLERITGKKIPRRLNAGFLLTRRFDSSIYDTLEDYLQRIHQSNGIDVNHHQSAQAYYAMCAAEYDDIGPFSTSYRISLGKTLRGSVIRHYVGIPTVRYRFYTEGIFRILTENP